MNEEGTLSLEDLHVQFKNNTGNTLCHVSFCETSNGSHAVPRIKYVGNGENYLERSLGFLVVGIIGVVSNGFAIFILGSSAKIRQKLVNTLIIHQSFVDFLASVMLIGTAHIDGSDQHGLEGIHADIYCFFLMGKWPLWVMIDVSSFSLMFLNIERYISIVHPIYHHTKVTRKKVLTLLPIVWFLGLLEQSSFASSFVSEDGACVFGSPDIVQILSILYLVLHFFLPVVLVLFLYGHMILKLRSAVNTVNNTSLRKRNDVMEKAKKNVFKTMLSITLCYTICYVFNGVYLTLMLMGILQNISGK